MPEAPRWRLTNPHYLNVFELPDGTRCEWEHKETARETGRMVRKLYPVPVLLNPADAADCNYPGEVIVAHEVDGAHNLARDIIFHGPPTPEMEPLNEAAQALTDIERDRWTHPIESLPANGGMTSDEQTFMAKMMEAFARVAPPPVASVAVTQAQYDELKEQVAKLTEALVARAGPTSHVPDRRV
jgi:hypothetical protein